MRPLLIVISLAVAPLATSFADAGNDLGVAAGIAAPTLPGFDLDATSSGSDLSPAATFSIAMEGAFLTPDGISLAVKPTGVSVANWGGPRNVPRRVRSVIGFASPSGGGGGSGPVEPAPAEGNGASVSAIPEPGTFFTGLVILGFCAGSRRRGSRRC